MEPVSSVSPPSPIPFAVVDDDSPGLGVVLVQSHVLRPPDPRYLRVSAHKLGPGLGLRLRLLLCAACFGLAAADVTAPALPP